MKALATFALWLAAGPLVAQVCPKQAPVLATLAVTDVPVEGVPTHLLAAGFVAFSSVSGGPPGYVIQPCDVIQWTFGDGTSATVVGSGFADHTYAHFGSYEAKAHISNALGAADSSISFYVTGSPATYVDLDTGPPVSESAGSATVRVTRSGNLSHSNRVNWRLYSYSIGMVSDSGTLTFHPGETERNLTFPVAWDHRYWNNYSSELTLDMSPDGARVVGLGFGYPSMQFTTGLIWVLDADPKPTMILGDVAVSKGSASARVPVDLTNQIAYVGSSWAAFRTIEGSARDGVDYIGRDGGVPLIADTSRVFIEIPLKQNEIKGTRAFDVEIYTSSLPLLRSRATVTIVDASVAVNPQQISLAAGAFGQLTLSLSLPAGSEMPVTLSSSDVGVVTVPPTATILPDLPATVFVHGLAPGRATITIDAGAGNTTIVDVQVLGVRRRSVLH